MVKITERDKVLRNKAFKVASNPGYNDNQRGLASMFYKFFDKASARSIVKPIPDQQLADELHKPIIRKFKKHKVYFSFKDNIWGTDLADMLLLGNMIKVLDSYYMLLIFLEIICLGGSVER